MKYLILIAFPGIISCTGAIAPESDPQTRSTVTGAVDPDAEGGTAADAKPDEAAREESSSEKSETPTQLPSEGIEGDLTLPATSGSVVDQGDLNVTSIDDGPVGTATVAEEPTSLWTPVTADITGLKSEFAVVGANVYGVVTDKVSQWNGTAWSDATGSLTDMKTAFHVISNTQIYAMTIDAAGTGRIKSWNSGTSQWVDLTGTLAGMRPVMQFVSATEIYVMKGNQICVWNGTAWTPYTPELAGMREEFKIAADKSIYAVVGNRICKWTSADGWVPYTAEILNLSESISMVDVDSIIAVAGHELIHWGGVKWTLIPGTRKSGLGPEINLTADFAELYTILEEKVCKLTVADAMLP